MISSSGQRRLIVVLAIIFLSISYSESRDYTLYPGTSGKSIVEAVLQKLLQLPSFLPDYLFLRRIAFVESQYGMQDSTYYAGYHGGIWQVEEEYFQLTLTQISHPGGLHQRARDIISQANINISSITWKDLRKPFYSGVFCVTYFYVKLNITEDAQLPSALVEQATIWQQEYRPSLSKSVFLKSSESLGKVAKCWRARPIDVAFLIDTSASLGFQNFRLALKFVVQLSSDFRDLSKKVRIALLTYSTETKIQFPYTEFEAYDNAIKSKILSTKYLRGNTYTGKAIRRAVGLMHQDRGSNSTRHSTAIQTLVLITDGKSSDEVETANKLALEHGIKIYAIGVWLDELGTFSAETGNKVILSLAQVGNQIDLDTLLTIVDGDKSRVFQAINYSNLVSSLRDVMVERACSTPTLLSIGDSDRTFSEMLPSTNERYSPEDKYQIHVKVNSLILLTFKIQDENNYEIPCSPYKDDYITVYSAPGSSFVNSAYYTSLYSIELSCSNNTVSQCHPLQNDCKERYSVQLSSSASPRNGSSVNNVPPVNNPACNAGNICATLSRIDRKIISFSMISKSNETLVMSVSSSEELIEGEDLTQITVVPNDQTAVLYDLPKLSTVSEDDYSGMKISITNSGPLASTTTLSNYTNPTTHNQTSLRPDHPEDEKGVAVVVICAIAGAGASFMALYFAARRCKKEKKRAESGEGEET